MKQVATITPPSSLEAEEYILGCGMLDGGAVMTRCIMEKVTPECFFFEVNRLIYQRMRRIHARGDTVDLLMLLQDYQSDPDEFTLIGGYAHFTYLSGKGVTTVHLNSFLKKLHKLASLRKILSVAQRTIREVSDFSGDNLEQFIVPFEDFAWELRSAATDESRRRKITDLTIPPENDPATLLGDRYVCRGHACMIVGGSGMGKSTIAYQASVCWALGKPFLGIAVTNVKGWLSSVHFQSEDEEGDIAEVRECVFSELRLTEKERQLVGERVIIVTEKVKRGQDFINDMAVNAAQLKSDLVWINPLHAFMSGDIKDSRDVGEFCRGGLNAANKDSRWAYMIVHHTPKPAQPAAGKEPREREWNEIMYEGAGSADLVNFCRAVQILKAAKTEGEFNLYLAKRGKKADVYVEKQSESGQEYVELVTKIPCKHSRNKIQLPGRRKPIPVMFWESRTEEVVQQEETEEKPARHGGARNFSDFSDGEFLALFPDSLSEPEDATPLCKLAFQQMGVSRPTIHRHKNRLIEEGYLQPMPNNGMKRTGKGDDKVHHYLSQRP